MQYNVTLTNSEISRRINENIHSERNRQIMRMKLIDGLTYEKIAEAVEMSPRYVRTLVHRLADSLEIS